MVEAGQWTKLLEVYIEERKMADAAPVRAHPEATMTTRQMQRQVVERVLKEDMRGALSLLRGEEIAPPLPETHEEVERLMCLEPPPGEELAFADEQALAAQMQPVTIRMKEVKSRLQALNERRKAGPWPSGWRNAHICILIGVCGDYQQLRT